MERVVPGDNAYHCRRLGTGMADSIRCCLGSVIQLQNHSTAGEHTEKGNGCPKVRDMGIHSMAELPCIDIGRVREHSHTAQEQHVD